MTQGSQHAWEVLENAWNCYKYFKALESAWKQIRCLKVLENRWKVLEFKSWKFWNFAFVDNFEASTYVHVTSTWKQYLSLAFIITVLVSTVQYTSVSHSSLNFECLRLGYGFFVDNFGAWKMQLGSLKILEKCLNFVLCICYKPWWQLPMAFGHCRVTYHGVADHRITNQRSWNTLLEREDCSKSSTAWHGKIYITHWSSMLCKIYILKSLYLVDACKCGSACGCIFS